MRIRAALALAMTAAAVRPAAAESAGSKNREGNRLYKQGAYEAAEKAYLEAQAKAPERTELQYNLGNALLRQKKTDAGLQSLRNAVAKGERGLAASAWFNTGNALFESGKFKEAAESYVQSLRINPSDRDAKHNLELSLRKMNESRAGGGAGQQPEGGGSPNQPKPQDQPRDEDQRGGRNPADQERDQRPRSDPAQGGATRAEQKEGGFSRERALQILDALENQELAEQRKRAAERQRRKTTGKDW